MSLDLIGQGDFGAGIFLGTARHLIPDNGLYDLLNGLLDDDGSTYRRGGSQYLTSSGLGAAGLTWIWDGYLAGGQRTVVATPTQFGVVDGTDSGIVALGGSGLTQPKTAIEIGGVLLIGGGTMYGGSRMAADYSAGSVAVTNGSKTVTGTGTAWLANVDKGMLFRIGTARYYVVDAVNSDTSITLRDAYEGATAGGSAYGLTRLGTFPRISDVYLVVADRVLSCEGNRVYFSRNRSPGTTGLPPAGQLQYQTFDATDYHELPEGLQITGGRGIRGNAIVFATRGVWVISNMAAALTDPAGGVQQRLEQLDRNFALWSNEGISSWGNRLIVPATDGAYLIDGISAPEKLTRSLGPYWVALARAGRRCGGAVFYRGYYLVPVLDAANGFADLLACRVDRPVRTPLGVVYPWGRLNGAGSHVAGFAVRALGGTGARVARLLAADRASSSRVLDCSAFFEPAAGVKFDHDSSVHVLDGITRDFAPAGGAKATAKKVRLRYELEDAASDNPTILGYISNGGAEDVTTDHWGGFLWGSGTWGSAAVDEWRLMTGQAPESVGRDPFVFRTKLGARLMRIRFKSVGPAARLVLRSFDVDVRVTVKR